MAPESARIFPNYLPGGRDTASLSIIQWDRGGGNSAFFRRDVSIGARLLFFPSPPIPYIRRGHARRGQCAAAQYGGWGPGFIMLQQPRRRPRAESHPPQPKWSSRAGKRGSRHAAVRALNNAAGTETAGCPLLSLVVTSISSSSPPPSPLSVHLILFRRRRRPKPGSQPETLAGSKTEGWKVCSRSPSLCHPHLPLAKLWLFRCAHVVVQYVIGY